MLTPDHLQYTAEHEWIKDEGDGRLRLGITDYAQDELGDIVFVELPKVGASFAAGDTFAEIESTKSVGEVYAPVAGTVVEINEALVEAPELVNSSPYEDGWIAVIQADGEPDLSGLLDAAGYAASVD